MNFANLLFGKVFNWATGIQLGIWYFVSDVRTLSNYIPFFQISALRHKLPWQTKQRKFSMGKWILNGLCFSKISFRNMVAVCTYRGSLPNATFGSDKKLH